MTDETSRIVAVTEADKDHVQRILGIAGVTVDIDAWGKLHAEAARHREQATASLREERDALRALLEGRDKFIVDAGLWHQFVDSLPSAMGEG